MDYLSWELLGIMGATIAAGWFFTAMARVIALRINLTDKPDGIRKKHTRAMPLMGGIAVFATFATMLLIAAISDWSWLTEARTVRIMPAMFVSATLVCALGLCDDRWSIRPRYKLILQIAAAVPFVVWGSSIDVLGAFGHEVHLRVWAIPFTLFWIVACMNIINLVDGLDGLAGTIGSVVILTMTILTLRDERLGLAAIGFILFGSIVGFLIHNWPPAKIYLGDCGSLLIGFLIGAYSIESSLKTAAGITLVVPLVILGIPIFDTAVAIIRRKLNGKGIGEADRGHIHHRLLDRGLTRAQSLSVILVLSVLTSASALLSVFLQNELIGLGLCAAMFIILVAGRVFGHDETTLLVAQVRTIGALFRESRHVLKTRLLLTRLETTTPQAFNDAWLTVQRRVSRMGGCSIEFLCWNESDEYILSQLQWQNETAVSSSQLWRFSYSVQIDQDRRVAVRATGFVCKNSRALRIDDLFHLFEALCQHWSPESTLGTSQDINSVIPEWALEAAEVADVRVLQFPDDAEKQRAA
ncbi:MAG: hypothetical protein CMJ78_21985 [Planctomycetaceae bacterium]|nr:hypothetical protein [Planctomycetaceae bacterium]